MSINDSASRLQRQVRSGLIWSAVQNWALRLGTLVLFLVMARLLAPAQMGLFATASLILAFVGLFTEQGLGEALIQSAEVTPSQLNAVFWLNVLAAGFLTGLLIVLAPLIAAYFKEPDLTMILRVSSISLIFSALSFGQVSMHRRLFEYRRIAVATLIATAISGAIGITVAVLGYGVWGLVAQFITNSLFVTLLLWIRPVWKLSAGIDWRAAIPLLRFGSARLGTYVLAFVSGRYIELILASMLGTVALGIYAVGVKLPQALSQVVTSTVMNVALNGFSRVSADAPKLRSAYYTSIKLCTVLALPVFGLTAALSPWLTVVLFGSQWQAASMPMAWIAILGGIQLIGATNGTVLAATGRPSWVLGLDAFKVLLTLAILHFSNLSDLRGLVIAYVVAQSVAIPVAFVLARSSLGISIRTLFLDNWPAVASIALSYAAVIALGQVLDEHKLPPLLSLVALGATAVVVNFGALVLMRASLLTEVVALVRGR